MLFREKIHFLCVTRTLSPIRLPQRPTWICNISPMPSVQITTTKRIQQLLKSSSGMSRISIPSLHFKLFYNKQLISSNRIYIRDNNVATSSSWAESQKVPWPQISICNVAIVAYRKCLNNNQTSIINWLSKLLT